jgi:hypothetical protein
MHGLEKWIGAGIGWRINVAPEPDVVFAGRIDTVSDLGEGVTRISGALAGGGRFVLVTENLTNV